MIYRRIIAVQYLWSPSMCSVFHQQWCSLHMCEISSKGTQQQTTMVYFCFMFSFLMVEMLMTENNSMGGRVEVTLTWSKSRTIIIITDFSLKNDMIIGCPLKQLLYTWKDRILWYLQISLMHASLYAILYHCINREEINTIFWKLRQAWGCLLYIHVSLCF